MSARDKHAPEAQEALAQLCRTYWYPLYAFVRRRGNTPLEAEDLTQGFFQRLLAKDFLGDLIPGTGRFRSFLLTSLKNYLANEWDRSQALKRGGGTTFVPLNFQDADGQYQVEPADPSTPEMMFDRRWALTVLDCVLRRLREEFAASQKAEIFDQLKGLLTGDQPDSGYAQIADRLGLSEANVKVIVHRMRRRFRELLRVQVAETVSDPSEIDAELRYLIEQLAD